MNNLPTNIDRDAFAEALAPFGLTDGVSGVSVTHSGVEAILNNGTVAYIPWQRKPKYVDGVYQLIFFDGDVVYYRCISDVFYDEEGQRFSLDDEVHFVSITRIGDVPDSGKVS